MKKIFLILILCFATIKYAYNSPEKNKDEKRKQVEQLLREADSLSQINMIKALRKVEDALYITNIYELEDLKGTVFYQKGKLLTMIGEKGGQEIEFFIRSLDISEKYNDTSIIISANTAIGHYYIQKNNFSKAEEYYKKSLKTSQKFKDSLLIGNAYINMGTFYANKNMSDSSLFYLNKSLLYLKDQAYISGVKMNIASLLRTLEEYDSSEAIFRVELKKTIVDKNGYLSSMLYLNLSWLYIDIHEFSKSRQMIDSAIIINSKLNSSKIKHFILDQKYTNYKTIGDYKNALIYLENLRHFNDSITDSNFGYLKEKIMTDIENEKNETQLLLQKRRLQLLITLSVIGMLLLLSFVFYYNQRNKLRRKQEFLEKERMKFERQQLELSVSSQQRELTSKTLMLANKNEIISEVTDALKESQKTLPKDVQNMINTIIKNLNNTIGDNFWDEFEQYFGKIHKNFYSGLIIKHPGLTAWDLRLCAFYKLKMSNKEVAQITNKQLKSITVARYRLRKKLNIDKSVDIAEYLSNF
ncbi:MAG: tetratricopeptide repeat protein [Bacteroidetes bacterium]|nr:tetratricopeptide repeat protein [Bacteroidota bacterium]